MMSRNTYLLSINKSSSARAIFVAILLLSSLLLSSQEANANECAIAIAHTSTKNTTESPIAFLSTGTNKVLITGNNFYPLNMIYTNLGLTGPSDLLGKSVVSVAEGYSQLLPSLTTSGVDAIAVDPSYPLASQSLSEYSTAPPAAEGYGTTQKPELLNYISNNAKNLLHGYANKLPLGDKSVDVVLNHKLLNNDFSTTSIIQALNEWIRVAKSEIRVSDIDKDKLKLITKYLNKKYGVLIEIEIKELSVYASVANNEEQTHTTQLLIIRLLD